MAPACKPNARHSIHLYVRVLDHLAPFLRIGLDECGILLRRAGNRLQRVGEEHLLAILSIRENAPDLAVEPGDDIRRACRWAQTARTRSALRNPAPRFRRRSANRETRQ